MSFDKEVGIKPHSRDNITKDQTKTVGPLPVATTISQDEEKSGGGLSRSGDDADDAPAPRSPEARPECFRSTVQEILFVLTATMAIAMGSFVVGSVTVIASYAGNSLNMTTAEVTWISASSSLSSGAFLLFFGRVADLFGRKSLVIGSFFIFSVLSIGAGFSRNAITLDVLNGIMGICSASCVPPAQGILGVIYEKPSRRKNAVFACYSAGNPLGFVFGMICSGIATRLFGWRASFWLMAIIYVIFTIIAIFTIPTDTTEKQPLTWKSIKRVDFVGTLLTVAGIGIFSASLSLAGDAPQGWKTPYVPVLLVVGILLIVAFVIWEMKTDDPMIPLGIWRDQDFSLLIVILLLGFLAFPVMQFWIAIYMQRVWHLSALEVAVHMLPMAISGILVNVVAGLILHRVSNKLLTGIGALAYTVAFILAALHRTGYSYWGFLFPTLVIVVIGADLEFNVTNMYILSTLPAEQQSIAGSIFQTVTKLCMAVGFGISTAIFNAVAKNPSSSGYHANDPFQPYAATLWYCVAVSAIAIFLVPFLRIKTQGHSSPANDDHEEEPEIPLPMREKDIEAQPSASKPDSEANSLTKSEV